MACQKGKVKRGMPRMTPQEQTVKRDNLKRTCKELHVMSNMSRVTIDI